MDGWNIGMTVFSSIAVAQSFFLGAYLLIKKSIKPSPNFFLGLMLLALSIRISKSVFYLIGPEIASIAFAIGAAALWVIGPCLWLFTKSCQFGRPSKWDYLHYAPSLIPLFVWSAIECEDTLILYRIGYVIVFVYLLACTKVYREGDWGAGEKRFKVFLSGLWLIWLTYLISWIFVGVKLYTVGLGVCSLVLYGFGFVMLRNEKILNEPSLAIAGPANVKSEERELSATIQGSIESELRMLFEKQKIYRQKGLTLAMVARELERPSYLVSKVINQHFGLKFNEFVNRYRVEEVKRHLQDQQRNPTVEAIAKEVGFSSTSSMYNAFKKETNLTPQAFRKGAQNGF